MRAGPGGRAGSKAQGADLSQEPTPQRAGAGPGFRACPRGREGPQGSPPWLSRQLGSTPAVLCPPSVGDAPAWAAHCWGRPLPRIVLFLRLPSGHLAGYPSTPQCAIQAAHIPLLRARCHWVVWSPALPRIRAEQAWVARTCRCPFGGPGTDSLC